MFSRGKILRYVQKSHLFCSKTLGKVVFGHFLVPKMAKIRFFGFSGFVNVEIDQTSRTTSKYRRFGSGICNKSCGTPGRGLSVMFSHFSRRSLIGHPPTHNWAPVNWALFNIQIHKKAL